MFKDGSRINSGVMPELSSLERVEILKGSAAILYGNVSAGGIINMVTKQPKFVRGSEISMRVGSFDLYKPSVDFYGPISKKIAYRVNGTYENSKSYRDVPASERYYINPSLLFKFSEKTELVLQADYLKHNFTPDFGIGSYDNTKIPDVPRGTFYGTPWQYAKTQQTSATATVKHQFSKIWQMNSSFSYQQYDRDYYSTDRIQAMANGDWAIP
jgi:iron complex outermembrane receptor protein